MLVEKLEQKDGFTRSQKEIANYILTNPEESAKLTAQSLGQKSFTSKATVIRFCQKLGFSGYEKFREQLNLEIAERLRIKLLLEKEPVNENTTLTEMTNIVPNLYKNTTTNINLNLNELVFKRIISHLRKATTVYVYGFGITYTCALAAEFKLRTLGIPCSAHSGLNEHYIQATLEERNRVAILLSFTGGNKEIITIGNYLKKSGVFVIGIGGNGSASLKEICDEYIEIPSKNQLLSMEVMPSYIGVTYVFDLIFSALLVTDFTQNVDSALKVIEFKK